MTAWIFGLEMAKEGWYSAIMAPLFVVSAMDSGLALLLLSLLGLDKAGVFRVEKKLMSNLAGLLATCIAIDGFLVGCEVLTMAYPGAAGAETPAIMATGVTASFFWFEILVGVVIPFAILVFAKNRARMGLVAFASVCVVLGAFCKRVWLPLTSFFEFNVAGGPGVISGSTEAIRSTGTAAWSLHGLYAPQPVEIVIVVGVIALGALAFVVLSQKLLKGSQAQVDAARTAKASSQAAAKAA